MQAVFIVGKGQWLDEEDVVQLPVDDKFVRLPVKIQSFFRHALAHYDFDFLFKCDDDTYLHTERLLTLPVKGVEFIGSDCDNHRSVAQGGAGYLLSRRAVGLVANILPYYGRSEDTWVSYAVQREGIPLHFSARLKKDHLDYPRMGNDLITAHRCSTQFMRLIDEGIEKPGATDVFQFYMVQHTHWVGPLKLLRNGVFLSRSGGLSGRWEMRDHDETLVLNWNHWPATRLKKTATGYGNLKYRLDLLETASSM